MTAFSTFFDTLRHNLPGLCLILCKITLEKKGGICYNYSVVMCPFAGRVGGFAISPGAGQIKGVEINMKLGIEGDSPDLIAQYHSIYPNIA